MPKDVKKYNILVSCPGDVKTELKIIEDVVAQFNSLYSDNLGISIETRYWKKDSYAQSGGEPQALLNKQIVEKCDAAVAILWTRFGSPTNNYDSGTEEEIEYMLSSGKQVFMYFSDKEINPSTIDNDEYKKILEFRDKYKTKGIYNCYTDDSEFRKIFNFHLTKYFMNLNHNLQEEVRQPILKLVGIDQQNKINEIVSLTPFKPKNVISKEMYLTAIRKLYEKISSIRVSKYEEIDDSDDYTSRLFKQRVMINDDDRNTIKSFAQELKIEINNQFFNLGNLVQSTIPQMIGGGYISGNESEKEKYGLINKLLDFISRATKWIEIEDLIGERKCIRLALQNSGTNIDEDVEITFSIPKDNYLFCTDFLKVDNTQKGYLLNDFNLKDIFGIRSSINFSDYDSSIKDKKPFVSYKPKTFFTEPDYSDDFDNELDDIFCYSCFENDGYYTFKLKIQYIKHNTCVAFPSVIFITNSFMSIPYSITSKNTPNIIKGEISVVEKE